MVGFFGSGLPAFCFTFSQTHIESGITGVLNSLTPVFTFVLGVLLFGMKFEKNKLLGLIIALVGAPTNAIIKPNNLFFSNFIPKSKTPSTKVNTGVKEFNTPVIPLSICVCENVKQKAGSPLPKNPTIQ